VVATKNGPMVQLDTAAKCVLAPIKFVDFLAQELKVSPRALTPKLLKDRRAGHQLTRDGQSLKFTAPHCKRVYRLRGIAETRCDETYFEMTDKATGETERITVWDFFMRNFPDHMRQCDPSRPPALCGPAREKERIMIPSDLLQFAGGQVERKITAELQREMMNETVKVPRDRFQVIEQVRDDLRGEMADPAAAGMAEFGLSLEPHLATVRGRVLPPAPLEYRQGRDRSSSVTPIDGSWNLRDGGGDFKFIGSARCECFATLVFDMSAQQQQVRHFVQQFCSFAEKRGMDIGQCVDDLGVGHNPPHDLLEWLSNAKKQIEDKCRRKLGFFLCILPPTNRRTGSLMGLYQTLKRWSHVVSYLPTQCVLSDKALGKLMTNNSCARRVPEPQPCLPRTAPVPMPMAGTTRACCSSSTSSSVGRTASWRAAT
jgi:hypothetical protein